MEKIQKDINPSMRAILIDWLVEVMFLAVNYSCGFCQFLHFDSISHEVNLDLYYIAICQLEYRVHCENSVC